MKRVKCTLLLINMFGPEIDVFISKTKNSCISYKLKDNGQLECDHIHFMPSEYNYGRILNTTDHNNVSENLEAIIIIQEEVQAGTFIHCKFLGLLEMIQFDNNVKKTYSKLLMCPTNKIDSTSSLLKSIDDININTINYIKYSEVASYSHIDCYDILGPSEAIDLYITSINIPLD